MPNEYIYIYQKPLVQTREIKNGRQEPLNQISDNGSWVMEISNKLAEEERTNDIFLLPLKFCYLISIKLN